MPPHHGGNQNFSNPRSYVMTSKKQLVRKPSKKIADSRRVRYGSSSAPRVVRSLHKEIRDPGVIRFGSSSAPASLRK
jgi:hypothetical protein